MWIWTTIIGVQLLVFEIILSFLDAELPGRTLFVVAHPDDEVMFFGPSILRCERAYVLSLSRGWPAEDGRTSEFFASCRVLGLGDRCYVDDRPLLDGFQYEWSADEVRSIVSKYVGWIEPDRIVTFDREGVSGHPNHISVSRALSRTVPDGFDSEAISRNHTATTKKDGETVDLDDIPLYQLQTGWRLVKYGGCYAALIYLAISDLKAGYFFLTPGQQLLSMTLQKAFLEHHSQVVWYRVLWMVLSRFVFLNHLVAQEN
jgi:N-acetylglucosaminylphosphatidylinositol deacetylase